MIPPRHVWVIRTPIAHGEEFGTEAAAIARSWELTEPGKQRWSVGRQTSTRMERIFQDLLKEAQGTVSVTLKGRVARAMDLPQDGLVGDLWWVSELDDLVVLYLNEHRDLAWERMDMGKLPFSVFEELRDRARDEGW